MLEKRKISDCLRRLNNAMLACDLTKAFGGVIRAIVDHRTVN